MATRTLALALVIVSTMLLPGIAVRQVKHAGARQAAKSDASQTESSSSLSEDDIVGALWKTDEEYLAATGMTRTRAAADNGTTSMCFQPKEVCCCNKGGGKGIHHPRDMTATSKTCLNYAITCSTQPGPTCGYSFSHKLVDMRMCSSHLPDISPKLANLKGAADLYKTDGKNKDGKSGKETVDFLTLLDAAPNQEEDHGSSELSTRDYTIIVDRSASMGFDSNTEYVKNMPKEFKNITKKGGGKDGEGNVIKGKMPAPIKGFKNRHIGAKRTLWMQARGALVFLAPSVVAEDPDGIGLYFFDNWFVEEKNLCDADKTGQAFDKKGPGCYGGPGNYGCTNLASVLEAAMEPDTIGRAETIFVITDGMPSDKEAVKHVIAKYTRNMCRAELLSISFIQVGRDSGASEYLDYLDDDLVRDLGAKFDIVDALSHDELVAEGLTFLDVLARK